MPRLTILTSAALAALALAACDRPMNAHGNLDDGKPAAALRAVTQLECPDHQGALTRVRISPDGLSCDYAGPKGAEVTLKLVKVEDDNPHTILQALERQLGALLPSVAAKIAKANADADRADAEAARADAASEALEHQAEKAQMEAERAQALADKARAVADRDQAGARDAQARVEAIDARLKAREAAARNGASENVHVALPGVRVNTQGDSADVRLPGISVKAEGDNADVRVGPITIKADDSTGNVNITGQDSEVTIHSTDQASEIRTRHKGDGTRATYILADEEPGPGGWRTVGYEARGPEGGPLVIAVVKTKERHSDDDIFTQARALVRKNAGG
ncbi:MAG: methyltransferase type 11 [Caulobacteraceae bacterium]|nr:methyltransferase type 11 [Caulobacteraceae bacterium]